MEAKVEARRAKRGVWDGDFVTPAEWRHHQCAIAMSRRRPAPITQADMQRAIRAAKAEGVAELEIRIGRETVSDLAFSVHTIHRRGLRRLFPIANSPCNGAMPRRRPQYLVREFSRHGKPVWYCRRGGRRIRLRAEYGTPEFEAEFRAAVDALTSPAKPASDPPGSVAWLIARYRETTVWGDLSSKNSNGAAGAAVIETSPNNDVNLERERVFNAFRQFGYLEGDLDPLGFLTPRPTPELQIESEYTREAGAMRSIRPLPVSCGPSPKVAGVVLRHLSTGCRPG